MHFNRNKSQKGLPVEGSFHEQKLKADSFVVLFFLLFFFVIDVGICFAMCKQMHRYFIVCIYFVQITQAISRPSTYGGHGSDAEPQLASTKYRRRPSWSLELPCMTSGSASTQV